MNDRRPLVDAAMVEARRRWAETSDPVSLIAAGCGVAPSTVRRRAAKEGWPPRPNSSRRTENPSQPAAEQDPLAGERTEAPAAVEEARPIRTEPDSAAVRVRRLFRLIDMQIDAMERTMNSNEPATAQDQERHARAMSGILSNMDRVAEIAQTIPADGKTVDGAGDDAHARAEARRIREEIAARLERLNAQWLTRPDAE